MMKLELNMKILIFKARDRRKKNLKDWRNKLKWRDWMQLVSLDRQLILSKIKEMRKTRNCRNKSRSNSESWKKKRREGKEEIRNWRKRFRSLLREKNKSKKQRNREKRPKEKGRNLKLKGRKNKMTKQKEKLRNLRSRRKSNRNRESSSKKQRWNESERSRKGSFRSSKLRKSKRWSNLSWVRREAAYQKLWTLHNHHRKLKKKRKGKTADSLYDKSDLIIV